MVIKDYQSKEGVDQFQLHKTLGDLAKLEKNNSKYIKEYQLAYNTKKDCDIRYPIIQNYLDKWKLDSAKLYFDTTLICEKNRDFYFYNGLINYRSRNYDEALKNYKFARELAPTDKKVRWRYKQVFDIIFPPVVEVDSNAIESESDTTLIAQ